MANVINVLKTTGFTSTLTDLYNSFIGLNTFQVTSSTRFVVTNSTGTIKFDVTGSGFTYPGGALGTTGTYTKSTMSVNGTPVLEFNYSPAISIAAFLSAVQSYAGGSATQLNNLFSAVPSTINGNIGNDTLYGLNNADTMNGNAGNDILIGGGGNDILNPGASKLDANGFGFELVSGGAGSDKLNIGTSGAAHTIAGYFLETGTHGITANLATNLATDTFGNTDTLTGITFLVATKFADTLTGDSTNDFLAPGGGIDNINGGAGFDELDYYFIKQFNGDAFNFTKGITANLSSVTDNAGTVTDPTNAVDTFTNMERIAGTRFADTFNGGSFADSFIGGDGADIFNGGGGNDEVTYYQEAVGGGTLGIIANLVAGTIRDPYGKTDKVTNIEQVVGTNVADSFLGNSSANTFSGNAGNDTVNGGLGNDILSGGAGNDFFVFDTTVTATTNRDTITDFNVANDTIRLSLADFAALGTTAAALDVNKFWASQTGAAHDTTDRILYNTLTGQIFYDPTGNAVANDAILVATLSNKVLIGNADFAVIA